MNDRNALINCSSYRDGKKLAETSIEAISDVLMEKGTFVWVGLFEPDQELIAKIQ